MKNDLSNASVYDRVFAFFEFVTKTQKMLSVEEFYKRTAIANGYFRSANKKNRDAEEGKCDAKRDVNVGTILKITSVFPNASSDYFLFGKGDMFKAEEQVEKQVFVVSSEDKVCGVPYYDVDFRGGFEDVYNDSTNRPTSYINIDGYNKEGNIWCNISGHSMHPVIQSGDKICIRPMQSIASIIYGEIYAIVTDEMRTVKYVTRSDKEGHIRLIPENKDPRFGDYQDIPISSIIKIFKVVGSVHLF